MPLYGDRKREYDRAWMAARRAAYFKGKRCATCGSEHDLELDHIDPAQKVTHRVWSWAAARREAELEKCQPLCAACHARKTSRQANKHPTHGTYAMYAKRCRCDECKEAVRLWWREYRANKNELVDSLLLVRDTGL